MASPLICDGCGAVIRPNGTSDEKVRLRLLTILPGVSILDRVDRPAWDFCGVGCVATWAIQQETEAHR